MQALKSTPDRHFQSLTVQLVDDRRITEINRRVFQRNKATDVIALTYDPIPGESPELEGELFINTERALQMNGTPLPVDQELALYLAHGCDHLAGSEDDTEEKKAAMLKRNQQWVDEAHQNGMLAGMIE